MRHYILASHGRFAKGIYESVQIILGEQPHVHVICGYIDGETDIKDKIRKVMASIPQNDEIIACSDLLGGSVNNELMKFTGRKNFYLITGMNLPLLINLFLYKDEDTPQFIKRTLSDIQNSIIFCNETQKEIDEDF